MTLKQLEKIVVEHLRESGEIRTGLKELQDSHATLLRSIFVVIGFSFLTLLSVVGFFIKVSIPWK